MIRLEYLPNQMTRSQYLPMIWHQKSCSWSLHPSVRKAASPQAFFDRFLVIHPGFERLTSWKIQDKSSTHSPQVEQDQCNILWRLVQTSNTMWFFNLGNGMKNEDPTQFVRRKAQLPVDDLQWSNCLEFRLAIPPTVYHHFKLAFGYIRISHFYPFLIPKSIVVQGWKTMVDAWILILW